MGGFIKTDLGYINRGSVKMLSRGRDSVILITEDNVRIPVQSNAEIPNITGEILGENFVVQLIIPSQELFVVYDDPQYQGDYIIRKIHCLALCADGKVRGVDLFEGRFDVINADEEGVQGIFGSEEVEKFYREE